MNNTLPKVGDIFNMSWGWDQTNNNWFQVTRLTPKGIYIREISSQGAGGEGFMCQNVVGIKDAFKVNSQWCGSGNRDLFRKVGYSNGLPHFNIHGRYFAFIWDGKPVYESHYA